MISYEWLCLQCSAVLKSAVFGLFHYFPLRGFFEMHITVVWLWRGKWHVWDRSEPRRRRHRCRVRSADCCVQSLPSLPPPSSLSPHARAASPHMSSSALMPHQIQGWWESGRVGVLRKYQEARHHFRFSLLARAAALYVWGAAAPSAPLFQRLW